MGITGLLPFVTDATDNIHIDKYAGKSVAIDTYCWIHRGAFACADKLAKGEKTDVYVNYCKKYLKLLLGYKVKPILVFDGCHLPSKQRVEDERAEKRRVNLATGRQLLREGKTSLARTFFTKCVSVTSEMALEVMNMAREMGVDCIVAPYEADSQLAFFSKNDIVEAIITEDSDLLCFGCKRVIFKLDLTGRGREVVLENLGRVKNLVGFTPDLFRHMCILSGCDYLPSIKGVGLTKACKALKLSKSKDSYQIARKLHQYIKGLPAVEPTYGSEFEKADQTFLYQLVFDPRARKLIPLTEYPQNLCSKDLEFAGHLKPDIEAFQIAIGNINVNNSKKISNFNIDQWLSTLKSDKRLKSIWKSNRDFFKPTSLSQVETFVEKPKPENVRKNPADKPHLIKGVKREIPSTPLSPEDILKAVTEDNSSYDNEIVVKCCDNEPQQHREDDDDLINSYTKKDKPKTDRVLLKSRFFAKKKLHKPIFPFNAKVKSQQNPSSSNAVWDDVDDFVSVTGTRSYLQNPFARKHKTKRNLEDSPNCLTTKKRRSLPSAVDPFNCSMSPVSDCEPSNKTHEVNSKKESRDLISDLFDVKDDENIDKPDSKLSEDTKNVAVDECSLHSDEGIAILDNIPSPTPLQSVNLNVKPHENAHDVVCISDEEAKPSCSLKPAKKTLGLTRTVSRKPNTGKSSKYFCKAKASGLKAKQPSILNFFKQPKT